MLYVSDIKGDKIGVFDTYSETFRGYFDLATLEKALKKSKRTLYGVTNGNPTVTSKNDICRVEGIKMKMTTSSEVKLEKQKNGFALSCDFRKLHDNKYLKRVEQGWDLQEVSPVITKLTGSFKDYCYPYLRISADLREVKYLNNLFNSSEYNYGESIVENHRIISRETPHYAWVEQIVITGDTSNVLYWDNAFANLSMLKSVVMKDKFDLTHTYSLKRMFYNCDSLQEVVFPECNAENVRVATSMFAGCDALTTINMQNVTVSDNLRYIDCMFSDCVNLEELRLPRNMRYIPELKDIYIGLLWSDYNLKRLVVDKRHISSWKQYLKDYGDTITMNEPHSDATKIQLIGY